MSADDSPTLIVIGGFAGSGKSTLSKRLSAELRIPRLSSDDIGQTISQSHFMTDRQVDPIAVAYDVVFGLCAEFLQSGISTILDLNMDWAFQWKQIDAIRQQHSHVRWLPILLRCPWDVCMERIRERHRRKPESAPPELYMTKPHILNGWAFLERLERPDVHVVDASQTEDLVYAQVKHYLS